MCPEITVSKLMNNQSSEEMYEEKQKNAAYEYLCHLEETKIWMEAVLKETLPPTIELEENLRNGVYLAKLGHFIAPNVVRLSRIYDIFQNRYKNVGLQFRHTDNINYWIEALKSIGFPKMFLVETTDVYDKKNMPKVIYCIHALSAHLFQLGQAPAIEDLFGKVNFSQQDIDSVCYEIKKNSITVPAFQKIGGLLSKEYNNDINSLRSGIIAINNAIDEESEVKLLTALSSTSVGLVQVIPDYINDYLNTFKVVKGEKVQAALNRSLNKSYEPDEYDELLNQSEIQGHIRKVNLDRVWQDILQSIKNKKRENLKEIIATSFTEIKALKWRLIAHPVDVNQILMSGILYWSSSLILSFDEGRRKDFTSQNIEYYVNEALALDVDHINYQKSRDTIHTIIRNGNRIAKENARVLDAVSKVKAAVLSKNKERLLSALKSPFLKLSSKITDFAAPLYLEELEADLKMSENISHNDLKSSITILNEIAKITSAVDGRDVGAIGKLLLSPDIPFMALHARRQEKLAQNVENCLLTFLDIQECVDNVNLEDFQQTRALIHLEDINDAVLNSNSANLLSALQGLVPGEISSNDISLCMELLRKRLTKKLRDSDEELWLDDVKSVIEEVTSYKQKGSQVLEELIQKFSNSLPENILKSIENYDNKTTNSVSPVKKFKEKNQSWYVYSFGNDIFAYLNTAKKILSWSKPKDHGEKLRLIPINESKKTPTKNDQGKQHKISSSTIHLSFAIHRIILLQAIIRGFLVRKKVKKALEAIITIQRWWRGIRRKKSQNENTNNHQRLLNKYRNAVDKIIKIQAFWRGYTCRKKYVCKIKKPFSSSNQSFLLLKHSASLLKSHDYSTDLEIQSLKSCIVDTIKRNQELSCRLEEMDMKIRLLVQNRMSVEAIIAEKKKLQGVHMSGNEAKGIKAFSKEAKQLLDGYQQLFYLLQTDPAYLTRLIVHLPSRPNQVIQSCVLSLFNYGSNSRDAYFLLRLFRSALFEEVQCKFQKPVDAITGNPFVLRLAVAYARQSEGHNPLRNILGFLIEKVLNDKVVIDTNPVDIYKRWINQMETETGKRLDFPPTVTEEEALKYPEVVERLNHNLRILKSWVKCFLDRLSQCVNQFPYALRFITKLLKDALLRKFPQTPEKDILKIVGNLVYYQYINSAIVAPDAFFIVSLRPDQHIKVEQRRNLASIAKIFHFAATKKGFGEESKHLMNLNPFIIECHEEMKKFCRSCCDVSNLEQHFQITKYSEAALIDKPKIYITLEEIRECHKLLLEVRQEVAPDSFDPVHEILDDLGPLPSLATLIGCSDSSESTLTRAGKVQVCLELDNKFQSPPEDPTGAEKLFIVTKELIISRLKDLKGDTLTVAVKDPKHLDLATNLAKLELAGLVKSSDDYQDILRSLIDDIPHKQEYRMRQKEELNSLKIALNRLNIKKKFYEDQLAYYEQYLKTCLSNLTAPSNKSKQKKERSVKYSGTRLRDDGVLIAIDGVPSKQLKNVQFEISTTNIDGIYSVQGKFMGIEVEKIEIDIQELLKLQFEGHREMNLFGKAQINVNLLLHLLNKKFLGRTK